MKRILPLPFLVLTAALLPAAAQAAPGDEVRASQPENYCLGGIEDRKIIVDESQLENPFRQTTRLGCEVDGGRARTMPDLPAPSADYQLRV